MDRTTFCLLFVAGPWLICSIVPTFLFGMLCGEWGSNLVWGSLFGLGWCLAAFHSGNIVHDDFSTIAGLIWGWLLPVPIFLASGWLWKKTGERGRRLALRLLAASLLPNVPARTLMSWDQAGFHLPDYTLHGALSY